MFILVALLFSLRVYTHPLPADNPLLNMMEAYRESMVGGIDVDEVFKIESLLGETVDDPILEAKMRKYRKKAAKLPGQFFEIEMAMARKVGEEEIGGNETEDAAEEKSQCKMWHLGMNLNPSDGHMMDYVTGWHTGEAIGTPDGALSEDFLNSTVWSEPADYIAIVRHQAGVLDAVKVFKFSQENTSLLDRFKMMDPGRMIVTEGGPIEEQIAKTADNLGDDPIFSVDGDLALNWIYTNNGVRVALTGGHLSDADSNDAFTYGLGGDLVCNCRAGTSGGSGNWEISIIQDRTYTMQGTDHSGLSYFTSGPVYGNYAIFVSMDADSFPSPGTQLQQTIERCA